MLKGYSKQSLRIESRSVYCSNMAKARVKPKSLQYLIGYSGISVTVNVYTRISFDDAEEELKHMEEFRRE